MDEEHFVVFEGHIENIVVGYLGCKIVSSGLLIFAREPLLRNRSILNFCVLFSFFKSITQMFLDRSCLPSWVGRSFSIYALIGKIS